VRALPTFRSFRARVLTFVLGLLVLVLGAVFLSVQAAHLRAARGHVDEALRLTASAFERSLRTREQILVEKARLLSSDFAFKQAVATGDRATIRSALENHSMRVDADVMMLLEPGAELIASTRGPGRERDARERRSLVARAKEDPFGETSAIRVLGSTVYQLVVVPLFTPEPTAWIVIGFTVDDGLARELQQETGTEVSLLRRDGAGWRSFGTTLREPLRRALERGLEGASPAGRGIRRLALAGQEHVAWVTPVSQEGTPLVAVLQRSLDEALEPFMALRTGLFAIFGVGILLSLAGSVPLAAGVTRPVSDLVRGARRIERGDYGHPVEVKRRDELGTLAASFNAMMKGLSERDQVRDLLGRVVAPEVAEELLSKEIVLGGEERRVSVLFTDIRGFTGLAESEDPERLVRMLNTFLTSVSRAIEGEGGVVEEYMGDGAKALFGAPVAHADDALRAVRAALALRDAMPGVNATLRQMDAPPLEIGIGIHTGPVVAGRMGSLTRLKYTVVGDGVNLASRLEGLTRRYGVPVIASGATRQECRGMVFREVDRVRVKGREQPVAVHEPLGAAQELAADALERVGLHRAALERYRDRDWQGAEAGFALLAERDPQDAVARLFLQRIEALRRDPPGPDWDGVVTLEEK